MPFFVFRVLTCLLLLLSFPWCALADTKHKADMHYESSHFKVLVLPILPATGQSHDCIGLGVQYMLETTLAAHGKLRYCQFGWYIGKLFPEGQKFTDYIAGLETGPSPGEVANIAQARLVMGGRIAVHGQLGVSAWLYNAFSKKTTEAFLPLDVSTGLRRFRAAALALLETQGPAIDPRFRAKALWKETLSLAALRTLGEVRREHLLSLSGYPGQAMKPDLEPYRKAVAAAPDSYAARVLLGWGLYRHKDYAAARAAFEAALRYNPDGVEAMGGLLKSYQGGDLEFLKQLGTRLAKARGEEPNSFVADAVLDHVRHVEARATELVAKGQYVEALPVAQQAVQLWENAFGPNHVGLALQLARLAEIHKALHSFQQAEELLLRAISLVKQWHYGTDTDTADYLAKLAMLSIDMGDLQKAHKYCEESLAIYERRLFPEHPYIGQSLSRLALVNFLLGDLTTADAQLQRALHIFRNFHDSSRFDIVGSLVSLGNVYIQMGEYSQAEHVLQEALDILSRSGKMNSPESATLYKSLAILCNLRGEYAKAESLLQQALAIWKSQELESPDMAKGLEVLAVLYCNLGAYDKAEPFFEQALAITEKTLGPKHLQLANILKNKALMFFLRKNIARTSELLKQALVIQTNVLGPDHTDTADSMALLAIVLLYIDEENNESEQMIQRCMDIYDKRLENSPKTIFLTNVLAFICQHRKNSQCATDLARLAFALASQYNDIVDVQTSCGIMRDSLRATDNQAAAIFFGKLSVNAVQTLRQRMEPLDKILQKSFLDRKQTIYRELIDLLMQEGRLSEAQQILVMLKEQEHFEYTRKDIRAGDPRHAQALYNSFESPWADRIAQAAAGLAELDAKRQELERKIQRAPEENERLEAVKTQLAAGRTACVHLLEECAAAFASVQSDRYERLKAERFDGDAGKELEGVPGRPAMLSYIVRSDRLNILLTTATEEHSYCSYIPSVELNRLVGQFRQALLDPRADPVPSGRKLFDLLLAPVIKDLQRLGTDHLVFSLDGALRYVPMAALHNGQAYLVERFSLSLFTPVMRGNFGQTSRREWSVTGFGVSTGGEYAALPGVVEELNGIIRPSGAMDKERLSGVIYLNEDFNLGTFTQEVLQSRPAVHVASHFVFHPGGRDTDSFLLLGGGQRLTLAQFRLGSYDFAGVDLLTLSACETGVIPQDADGRELDGLAIVAQKKGAKAVLATLWPVADASTGYFMRDFYRLRQEKNLSKAEALRQAQIRFINGEAAATDAAGKARGLPFSIVAKPTQAPVEATPWTGPTFAHPYYWAPFILMGNWR
ncbi:CHAT domain-containing protein [Fundidesulfovibrio butyratiphilus]